MSMKGVGDLEWDLPILMQWVSKERIGRSVDKVLKSLFWEQLREREKRDRQSRLTYDHCHSIIVICEVQIKKNSH